MESGGEGIPRALRRQFPFTEKHRKQEDHPETASEEAGGVMSGTLSPSGSHRAGWDPPLAGRVTATSEVGTGNG